MIIIKSATEIEAMRRVNQMTGRMRTALAEMVQPGITTLELGNFAKKYIRE